MPDKKMNSIKNEEQYEALKDQGMSKEKAARIANSEDNGGGTQYENRTKKELDEQAKKIGISGYSQMKKDELIEALRNH
jgi:hypothetical protein